MFEGSRHSRLRSRHEATVLRGWHVAWASGRCDCRVAGRVFGSGRLGRNVAAGSGGGCSAFLGDEVEELLLGEQAIDDLDDRGLFLWVESFEQLDSLCERLIFEVDGLEVAGFVVEKKVGRYLKLRGELFEQLDGGLVSAIFEPADVPCADTEFVRELGL